MQLNDSKTELLLTGPKKFLILPSCPHSLSFRDSSSPFLAFIDSLGIVLDKTDLSTYFSCLRRSIP